MSWRFRMYSLVAIFCLCLFLAGSLVFASLSADYHSKTPAEPSIQDVSEISHVDGLFILAQAQHFPPIDHGSMAPKIDHDSLAPKIDHDALGPKVDHEGQRGDFQPGAPALPGVQPLPPPSPPIDHDAIAPKIDHEALRGDFHPGAQQDDATFDDLTEEEQAALLDALRRFAEGDHTALQDIMKHAEKIPNGMNVFFGGSGGLGVGVNGAGLKLDFLSAGLKVKKNHDGSVEIELAGQLGLTPGAEAVASVSGGGGLRAGYYTKISADGQSITFGQKIGAGVGAEGKLQTLGAGVFGRLGVDASVMGGWELEMPVERYAQLTPWERSWMSNPAYAAYLARGNEDIGLYITVQAGGSGSTATGGHVGGAWGGRVGFEGGVGWDSENYSIVDQRIHILWYWHPGHHGFIKITIVTIHLEYMEVTA
jgi:hypothetical protein